MIRKLLSILEQSAKENAELREEIQILRDENARLKGEKGHPRILPNVKGADTREDKEEVGKKAWDKGAKTARIKINRTETFLSLY